MMDFKCRLEFFPLIWCHTEFQLRLVRITKMHFTLSSGHSQQHLRCRRKDYSKNSYPLWIYIIPCKANCQAWWFLGPNSCKFLFYPMTHGNEITEYWELHDISRLRRWHFTSYMLPSGCVSWYQVQVLQTSCTSRPCLHWESPTMNNKHRIICKSLIFNSF